MEKDLFIICPHCGKEIPIQVFSEGVSAVQINYEELPKEKESKEGGKP